MTRDRLGSLKAAQKDDGDSDDDDGVAAAEAWDCRMERFFGEVEGVRADMENIRDELYKNRSSRKIDSRGLFSREYDFPKTFSLTENQFSQKTYFSTIASSPNAKTGTSAWMHVLLGLVPWLSSSATTQEDDSDWRGRFHAAAQRLFQMPMKWPGGKELFDLLFSFLFVRHPFVRLVSAYQDKVRT